MWCRLNSFIMLSHRFHGTVVVQQKNNAISFARSASMHQSTERNIEFYLFCDASRARDSDAGGIAITYKPWIPGLGGSAPQPTIKIAYPIYPLLDHRLGEFMAVSDSLFIA